MGSTEIRFKYRAHPKQALVHECPARFRVLIAGRRFGKTITAVAEACFHALAFPKSRTWYIAPTYRQSKTTAWRLFLDYLPPRVIEKKNEQDLEITLVNGSEIALKGTERPDLLRGVGLNFVILDEVAFMKEDTWEAVVRPMLTDTKGAALFIGTPAGFGDHDNEIEGDPIDILGEEGEKLVPQEDWRTFRFTTYDNPFIDIKEIQSEKETMNEDYFSQEYLARFTSFTGLVYNEFNSAEHIVSPFDIKTGWLKSVGVDIGYNHASAAIFLAVDEIGNIYAYDEIYRTGTTSSEFLALLKERMLDQYFQIKVADSSAADFIARAREEGLWFNPYKRPEHSRQYGSVLESINWVKDYLRSDKPRLFIFNNCKNLIREFQTYEWDNSKYVSGDRKPKKTNDDILDALRYAIMELKGRKSTNSRYDPDGKVLNLRTDSVGKEWDVSRL